MFVKSDKIDTLWYGGLMNHEAITHNLTKSGFSEKTALVYSYLLTKGGAYPSKISEATHLNRSTVYKILTDLSVKGLVTEIDRHNKLFYQVERPTRLLKYAEERKNSAVHDFEKVQKMIPEIEWLYSSNPRKPRIRFFENMEGLMSIFDDHVNFTKPYEMLGFANTAELEKFVTPEFLRKYTKKKERARITTRGIVPDSPADLTYNQRMYKGIKKNIWLNLRYIPKDQFPFNGEITIYGEDRVSIINFNKEGLVGIIIEDKAIHEMMTRIFELAWLGAKTTK